MRTGQRAVTAGDYERLTLESSIEVARARCLPAYRGNGSVRLLVVPQVRGDSARHKLDDFAIAAPLMRTITDHLNDHRVVGTAIEVSTPYYQGVSVAALVHLGPGRPAGAGAPARDRGARRATSTRSPAAPTATAGRSTLTSTRP